MPQTRGSTSYKKQDGSLVFDDSKNEISWTPTSSNAATLSLQVTNVINLKQTPAANPKVALKIESKSSPDAEVDNYVFNFTSKDNARAEQEAITNALRNAITAARSGSGNPVSTAQSNNTTGSDGQSAAMAIASAIKSGSKSSESWYDDQQLLQDTGLQASLLKNDPELNQRLSQSWKERPDTISISQFQEQFWSSRIRLLRAHAIERAQRQGAYNVLAEIKDTTVDGTRKLSLKKEQIQVLFKQHPVIKHVYNETVPNRLTESEFWARFFNSRLLRKLKGEPITDAHPPDVVLDKYLNEDENSLRNRQVAQSHVPHFIDLEGNEQHHSQRKGNQPDWTMRPEASGKAPILKVLNNMSEKMMIGVAPADHGSPGPSGGDEDTFNELRLRDLEGDMSDDRVVLNIKHQNTLFGGGGDKESAQSAQSAESIRYAKMNPKHVLSSLQESISSQNSVSLEASSNPRTDDTKKASAQVVSLLQQQRDLLTASTAATSLSSDALQTLLLTHNTTTEFLHYYWSLLLEVASGSSSTSRKDLSALSATLAKSLERISAVAEGAEKERQSKISDAKRAALEYQQKTGKKRKVDESKIHVGGRKEVEDLIAPTVRAIQFAQSKISS